MISFAHPEPLRSHVGPCSGCKAGTGQARLSGHTSDSEINQVGEVGISEQDVRRLDVAVQQADLMCGMQRRGDLLNDHHRPGRVQRPLA